MVTREELSSLIAEMHKNEVQGLAEDSESVREQRKERYKDWTTLFRRNLDIFNQDFLEIDVAEFQKVMINNISDNDVTVNVCSRGIGEQILPRLTEFQIS